MMDGEIDRLSETRMLLKVARIIIGHLEQPKDVNGIYLFDVEEAENLGMVADKLVRMWRNPEQDEGAQLLRFKHCPVCGRVLTLDDLDLYDDEGDILGELKSAMAPDGTFDRKALGELAENLDDYMTAVESVIIGCDCGFAFAAGDVDVRKPGWLKEFAEKANRRVGE